MQDLARYLYRTLQHRRLGESTGAIAGLASGLSVIAGMIAAHYAPRGVGRLALALHLTHKPFLLQIAPALAGVSVAFATAAGILRFYTWLRQREDQAE
jgi:hypothetical protein